MKFKRLVTILEENFVIKDKQITPNTKFVQEVKLEKVEDILTQLKSIKTKAIVIDTNFWLSHIEEIHKYFNVDKKGEFVPSPHSIALEKSIIYMYGDKPIYDEAHLDLLAYKSKFNGSIPLSSAFIILGNLEE